MDAKHAAVINILDKIQSDLLYLNHCAN